MAFTDQESLVETTAKVKYVREEVTRKVSKLNGIGQFLYILIITNITDSIQKLLYTHT